MTDDETPAYSFTRKQFHAIVGGIISGVFLVGGIGGSGILRVDKFGASDGVELKRDILADVRNYTDNVRTAFEEVSEHRAQKARAEIIRELNIMLKEHNLNVQSEHQDIRNRMPPPPTRERLQAVENCARAACPSYQQPTTEW